MNANSKPPTDADRFRDFAKRLVAVPKAEIDRRERANEKAKAKKAAKKAALA
jgi:hypothetical protein